MYYDVELTEEADDDLRRIGGQTENWLIGELFGLPRAPRLEFKELAQPEPGKAVRLRWRIGAFVVVFYERRRTGITGIEVVVAVVERVIRRRDLLEWLERETQDARHRDERMVRKDEDTDD